MEAAVYDVALPPGLLDAWHVLWEQDPTASVFHHADYLRAWIPEAGTGTTVRTVEIRSADGAAGADTKGLTTLGSDRQGDLTFLGDPSVTDYLGLLSAAEDRDAVAEAFVTLIADFEWEHAVLAGLAADSGWADSLARAAKTAGFLVTERVADVCPRIPLAGTYEQYLDDLHAKLRHEIKRKSRRLEREAGPYTVRLTDADSLNDDLERFFSMHRASDGPKGRFLNEGRAGLFSRIAEAFMARGWLRLSWLEVAGESFAAILSFSARGVWSVYNSAYDHRRRDLGPGMVLMAETIRLAAEEGCSTVDLLRGDEPYKYRFGATDMPVLDLTIRRP